MQFNYYLFFMVNIATPDVEVKTNNSLSNAFREGLAGRIVSKKSR